MPPHNCLFEPKALGNAGCPILMLNIHQSQQLVRLRWTAFAIVGLAYVLSFFHRFAPAAISADLQQTFHAMRRNWAVWRDVFLRVHGDADPTGILVDTLGPRGGGHRRGDRGIGSLLFGMADTLAIASAGRLLVGLGVSVTFIALLKLNAAWFHDRHFATMTGRPSCWAMPDRCWPQPLWPGR